MSIMYFVNETNKTFLRHPAFLVGNGINYSKENTISWTDLLIKLFSTDQADDSVIKVVNGEKQLDLDGLTYPEIAELAELYSISEKEKSENRKKNLSVKKRICRIIDENDKTIKNRENQKRLYELCNRNNIPILTTNYDHKLLFGTYDKAYTDYISGGIEELKWIFSETKKTKNSTYKELFNAFFRDNSFSRLNLDIRKEFAIWPIHGSKRYSSSICINSMDYARKISEINKRLAEKQDMWEQNENWEGKYTWLNIFLHNDLIIIGLGLDTNEIDLRWLLVERYIYQKWIRQHYPKEKEGTILYLYSEYKDSKSGQIKTMERGKKLFFESLGIKCIRMNRNDLYSFEWIKEY